MSVYGFYSKKFLERPSSYWVCHMSCGFNTIVTHQTHASDVPEAVDCISKLQISDPEQFPNDLIFVGEIVYDVEYIDQDEKDIPQVNTNCRYCKGTGKLLLFDKYTDCECLD